MLYPEGKYVPLAGHSEPGLLSDRDLIVLHITQGSTAAGAIETFRSSVRPHRVSAHFVIDRDGTVFQLLDISETAWHASQVNRHSVGIEHAAMAPTTNHPGMMATEDQYQASAKLVAWLSRQMGIPVDSEHVKEHCVASPADGHVECCHGALDPKRVIQMASMLLQPSPSVAPVVPVAPDNPPAVS